MTAPGRDTVVEVRTGARLHFGLLATNSDEGRLGGIGMMIDRPRFVLRAKLAGHESLIADAAAGERVQRFLELLRTGLEPWPDAAAERFQIEISERIPPHRGFGSGTQLAFAVASAMSKLLCFKPFVPMGTLGRGTRSLVGGLGYFQGGFCIDAGEAKTASLSGAIEAIAPCRFGGHVLKVPETWRVVVVDPQSDAGISGTEELTLFAGLKAMPAQTTGRLARLVTDVVVPGLATRGFEQFAAGVAEFNRLVGEHFAPVQGGVYAHPLIRGLSRRLADSPWPYLAQSSWGPAGVVFCESEESAAALCRFLGEQVSPDMATVFIAGARNRGADVRVLDRSDPV